MAIEFLLPMLASILQGGIGNAIAANQGLRMNNENIRLARMRRQELQPVIDQLRAARDYTQMDEQLVRDFSRASDQMAAQGAQTGMTNAGSGGLDQVRRDVLGAMIASMAQVKAQDDLQRENLLAQILSDPTLYEGERAPENVGVGTLFAGLGGGLAGAGTTLASFLSTKEGIGILKSLSDTNAVNNGPGIAARPVNSSNLPGVTSILGLMGTDGLPAPRPQNPYTGTGWSGGSPWRLSAAEMGF